MTEIHESMQRLYQFAKDQKKIIGQTKLANAMGESPQVIKNWESRGISQRGANLAQKKFGCDANWLLGRIAASLLTTPSDQPIQAPTTAHKVSERNPWAWPFAIVSRQQWDQLFEDEKTHIENDILLRVKNRGDPQKEEMPAPITANGQST